MTPVILTVAFNGSVPTRQQSPHVPLTPEEIASDADGRPTLDPDIFAEIHERISARTDLIVQISTGGRAGLDADLRAEPVRRIRPEMASLTTGSMNFPDQVYANSFDTVTTLAQAMAAAGTKPEMEIFEAGMIDNALALVDAGLATAPLHFDFVLGNRGSQPATARQLVHLSESLPQSATWTVAGLGRWQLPMGIIAMGMGGHVRVGLEDNLYYRRGELATNPQLVARMSRVAAEAERPVATPAEARQLLHLGTQSACG
ncbi:MAG: 3-keto-5-aminohexanoate cleavage protein [bacterium]|nr:3-keto-5-aminohexanoate cleavage protein [bacterium]